ncbi:hypothetical protein NKJ50_23220 [Mesorhizobium sp. M0115]|uniref:hypothetical protein n=1 Tax=Mesorhizobium sp. M0115 TaxID=2956883 RepID=UPI003337027F
MLTSFSGVNLVSGPETASAPAKPSLPEKTGTAIVAVSESPSPSDTNGIFAIRAIRILGLARLNRASTMMVKRKHIALSDLIPDQMATVCTKQANAAISLLSKKTMRFHSPVQQGSKGEAERRPLKRRR